jgi:tRNA-binding protein
VEISFHDFAKVDVRVGTVVDVQSFPEARRAAIKLWVDFGDTLGVKKTSAQLTVHYTLEELVGRQVAAVVLLSIDKPVPNGGRLF